MNPKSNVSIFLIGPMGAGKSTVGRALARLLKKRFLDADAELEKRTGASIPLIFDVEGEAGFRKREAAIIDELTQEPDVILATGGGAVLDEQNRLALRTRGVVVYLSAGLDTLYERTRSAKNRPLLAGKETRATLTAIMEKRMPIYESEADIVIKTDQRSANYVAREIVKALNTL